MLRPARKKGLWSGGKWSGWYFFIIHRKDGKYAGRVKSDAPRAQRGASGNYILLFLNCAIHPRLRGGAFSAPAGKNAPYIIGLHAVF